MIADHLASHFTPSVVELCKKHDIYFTTHLMQPLDVAFFRPLKVYWRSILEDWRKQSRSRGSIPKEQFLSLLSRLYKLLQNRGKENTSAGFRKTGLCPFNPQAVLDCLLDFDSTGTSDEV